jgi:hypothetical protein
VHGIPKVEMPNVLYTNYLGLAVNIYGIDEHICKHWDEKMAGRIRELIRDRWKCITSPWDSAIAIRIIRVY